MSTEHYKQTTMIIFRWFADGDTATARLLYERLDAAGLLLTDEKRAEVLREAADFLDQQAVNRADAGMHEAARLLRAGTHSEKGD